MTELPYYCPELRGLFLQSPCEANLAQIEILREKGSRISFTLEKCESCKGTKLKDQQMPRKTEILEAPDRVIQRDGEVTRKALAAELGITIPTLVNWLKPLEEEGFINTIRGDTDTSPVKIEFAEPKPAVPPPPEPIFIGKGKEKLPEEVAEKVREQLDQANEVQKKEEMAEIVQDLTEKTETVQETAPTAFEEVSEFSDPVPESVSVKEYPKKCKNHPTTRVHKDSDLCWNCWQKENREEIGKRYQRIINPDSENNPQEILFNWTMQSLPPFDPLWVQETWERWWQIWKELKELAQSLSGIEPDKNFPQEIIDGLLEGFHAGAIGVKINKKNEMFFMLTEDMRDLMEKERTHEAGSDQA